VEGESVDEEVEEEEESRARLTREGKRVEAVAESKEGVGVLLCIALAEEKVDESE
jgi:hypothetical protein